MQDLALKGHPCLCLPDTLHWIIGIQHSHALQSLGTWGDRFWCFRQSVETPLTNALYMALCWGQGYTGEQENLVITLRVLTVQCRRFASRQLDMRKGG